MFLKVTEFTFHLPFGMGFRLSKQQQGNIKANKTAVNRFLYMNTRRTRFESLVRTIREKPRCGRNMGRDSPVGKFPDGNFLRAALAALALPAGKRALRSALRIPLENQRKKAALRHELLEGIRPRLSHADACSVWAPPRIIFG